VLINCDRHEVDRTKGVLHDADDLGVRSVFFVTRKLTAQRSVALLC
jgi:hypothetical protein